MLINFQIFCIISWTMSNILPLFGPLRCRYTLYFFLFSSFNCIQQQSFCVLSWKFKILSWKCRKILWKCCGHPVLPLSFINDPFPFFISPHFKNKPCPPPGSTIKGYWTFSKLWNYHSTIIIYDKWTVHHTQIFCTDKNLAKTG